jgi:glycosyltransferase involved in cell wall biosynthesis
MFGVMKGVSVIIACYNAGSYLKEAVDSIYAVRPTLPFEILVVDDASTDPATKAALNEIDGMAPEVRVFCQPENRGQSAARNLAISQSKYDYILPLDADDKLNSERPGYIETAIGHLEQNERVFVAYSRGRLFGAMTSAFILPAYSERRILLDNMIPVYGVYRKADAIAVGGYKEDLRYAEDWELWLALSSQRFMKGSPRKAVEIPVDHYMYRQHGHGGNVSICQKIPMSELFSRLAERNAPLYRHHLGTEDPEEIAGIRGRKRSVVGRMFSRAVNSNPIDFVRYVADVWSYRATVSGKNVAARSPE